MRQRATPHEVMLARTRELLANQPGDNLLKKPD